MDDEIWLGDRCIAPDDPRNFGPAWERLTFYAPTFIDAMSEKTGTAYVSLIEAAAILGVSLQRAHAALRSAGITYARELLPQRYYYEREVLSVAAILNPNRPSPAVALPAMASLAKKPSAPLTIYEAAAEFCVNANKLFRRLYAAKVQPVGSDGAFSLFERSDVERFVHGGKVL